MRRPPPLLFALVVAGCQVVAGYQEFSEQERAASTPHPCDVLPGSKVDEMSLATLLLVKTDSGRCFWVDQTEVTVDQYGKFLAAAGSAPGWDGQRCAWKAAPSDPEHASGDACATQAALLDGAPFAAQRPIRCIDWCDAWQFCRWAGKDLCLSGGGVTTSVEPPNATDDWASACSGGSLPLPYGETYQPEVCNIGLEAGQCYSLFESKCTATAVGTFPSCRHAGGPLDMIGNVTEWTRLCTNQGSASGESCAERGGSYASAGQSWSCFVHYTFTPRDARRPDLGLRCCAALTPAEQGKLVE